MRRPAGPTRARTEPVDEIAARPDDDIGQFGTRPFHVGEHRLDAVELHRPVRLEQPLGRPVDVVDQGRLPNAVPACLASVETAPTPSQSWNTMAS